MSTRDVITDFYALEVKVSELEKKVDDILGVRLQPEFLEAYWMPHIKDLGKEISSLRDRGINQRSFLRQRIAKLEGDVIKDGDTVEVDRNTGELIRKINDGEKSVNHVKSDDRNLMEAKHWRKTDSTPSKITQMGKGFCDLSKEPPRTTITVTYHSDKFTLVSREDLEQVFATIKERLNEFQIWIPVDLIEFEKKYLKGDDKVG